MGRERTTFTLKVPARTYIKKYVLYYNNWQEPVPISRATLPGVILLPFLEKPASYDGKQPADREDVLVFSLHEYLAEYRGVELNNMAVWVFHNFFDAMFREELFSKVATYLETGHTKQAAIDRIRWKYQLTEEDFSQENFRKTIYREEGGQKQNRVPSIFNAIVPPKAVKQELERAKKIAI